MYMATLVYLYVPVLISMFTPGLTLQKNRSRNEFLGPSSIMIFEESMLGGYQFASYVRI